MEWITIAHAFSGLLIGTLVGLTGVGGGSLMTPLLTLAFGIRADIAIGTDLMFAGLTKCVGVATHRQHGHVHWRIVALLSLGSVPAAIATLIVMRHLDLTGGGQSVYLKYGIALSLLLTVVALFARPRIAAVLQARRPNSVARAEPRLATVAAGALIGMLVSSTSIGAGAIGATLILMLYPSLRSRELAGTDIAFAVPITLIAGAGHAWLGTVDWTLLAGLLLGSTPGIALGTRLSRALPEQWTRAVLATMLGLVAIKLVS